LAAAGIITMSAGWWLLAVLFNTSEPEWDKAKYERRVSEPNRAEAAWKLFRDEHHRWDLRYKAAGNPDEGKTYNAADYAIGPGEYRLLTRLKDGTPSDADLQKTLDDPNASKEAKEEARDIRAVLTNPDFTTKLAKVRAG